MIIRRVKLSNVRSYLSETIEFPTGSTLLSGDIGSGKSTILLAIEFALFGVIRGSVDGSALLRHGKSSGYVELHFEIGGKEVVVRRVLKHSKNGVSQSAGHIAIDGVKTDCTPVELKSRILELLNYPLSLIAKSKALIYRFTVYTPQEEMKHILFEDSAARLDTLRKVFQIEGYRIIRDNSAVLLRFFREKMAELSARAEELPAKQQQLQEFAIALKDSQSRLDSLQPLLNSVNARISAQQKLLKDYEERIRKCNSLKSELAVAEALVREKTAFVGSSTAEIRKLDAQISELKRSAPSEAVSSGFASGLSSLNSHVSFLKKEIEIKSVLKSEISAAEEKLKALADDVSRLEAVKQHSEALERNVLASEKCPVCLQPISVQHKAGIRSQIDRELSEAQLSVSKKVQEKEQLTRQLFLLKDGLDAVIEKERQFAELSALSGSYMAAALELGIDVPAASPKLSGQLSGLLVSLASMSHVLRSQSRVKSSADEKLSVKKSLEEKAASSRLEIASNNEKIAGLRSQLASYSSVEAEFSEVRKRLELLQADERQLAVKTATINNEIGNINSNISALQKEISAKEEARKLLASLADYRNWISDYFINLMEVIERHVMLRVHHEFSELFQNWFAILMEDETISARLDDSFTPVVEVNGYEIPLENLSGGEKTSCALAYRLALNKVVNDLITNIKTKDLLILDEPTDGFSAQQLEKVRDVLEQLALPQIIIVSHESKVESFVQHVIRVVKEEHVSRVIA